MELVGGRYEVTRSLAGGGMGSVCEAVDRVMGRRVALKTLHPHLAAEESLCERFRREALAAAALAHPHIAQATDYGVDPKHGPFLVMELLVGEALSERLARDGAFTPERAVFVAAQALDALAAAHDAGIVHRDIKPSNLFLTQLSGVADVVKVIDFGIAKLYESKTWQRLTATGQVIGTPTYMAPEQALGRPIDARVDVYAMGLVLYAMLTGRPAFRPGGPETIVPILEGRYVPLRELAPHVEPALAEVVARAMHVDRETRFPDARAMRGALAPWLPSMVSSLHAARPPSDVVGSVPSAPPVSNDEATRAPARMAAPPIVTSGGSVSVSGSPEVSGRRRRVVGLLVGGALLGALLFVGAFVAWSRPGDASGAPPVVARAAVPIALAEPSSALPSKPPRGTEVHDDVGGAAPSGDSDVGGSNAVVNDETNGEANGEANEARSMRSERDRASDRRARDRGSEGGRPEVPTSTSHGGVCEDTCGRARDGHCNDGRGGGTASACAPGTDCADCGPWLGPMPRILTVAPPPVGAAPPRFIPRRADCESTTYGYFESSPFGGAVVRRRLEDREPGVCLAGVGVSEAVVTLTTNASGVVDDVSVSPANGVLRSCLAGRLSGVRFDPAAAVTLRVPIFCR